MTDDAPPDDDPDGFDEARRREVLLRQVAINAQHDRERRIATMTPLEVAQSDLIGILDLAEQYRSGESPFPVTPTNTDAFERLIEEQRERVRQAESNR